MPPQQQQPHTPGVAIDSSFEGVNQRLEEISLANIDTNLLVQQNAAGLDEIIRASAETNRLVQENAETLQTLKGLTTHTMRTVQEMLSRDVARGSMVSTATTRSGAWLDDEPFGSPMQVRPAGRRANSAPPRSMVDSVVNSHRLKSVEE